jgi:Uma2 family endonuclease
VSSPTPEHQIIVQRIVFALMQYLQANPGRGLVLNDVEIALSLNTRVLPDVLWLRAEKAARLNFTKGPVPGCPDLAVEVISPSERAAEAQEKVRTYLEAGTAEVWQLFPKSSTAIIHSTAGIRESNELASPLLPGFSLAVGDLFKRP